MAAAHAAPARSPPCSASPDPPRLSARAQSASSSRDRRDLDQAHARHRALQASPEASMPARAMAIERRQPREDQQRRPAPRPWPARRSRRCRAARRAWRTWRRSPTAAAGRPAAARRRRSRGRGRPSCRGWRCRPPLRRHVVLVAVAIGLRGDGEHVGARLAHALTSSISRKKAPMASVELTR